MTHQLHWQWPLQAGVGGGGGGGGSKEVTFSMCQWAKARQASLFFYYLYSEKVLIVLVCVLTKLTGGAL